MAKKTKKTKTKKPTGLSITRSGDTYTFKWKIGDSNYSDGQSLQYILRINGTWRTWTTISVGASATSKSITLSRTSYYPYNSNVLTGVQFRVCGNRSGSKYTTSDWTNCTLSFGVPPVPSISSSISNTNVFNAPWSVSISTTNAYVYSKYEWQSILAHESNETDGSKLTWSSSASGWRTGNGASTEGTISITEDTSVVQSGSHTRWVRIRSLGLAGASAWRYTKHVFAIPYSANITGYSATEKESSYLVDLTWNATANASHPIDETTVEYAIGTPIANMQPPANPSWTEVNTSIDTSGNDRISFNTGTKLDYDECLFARVVTTHDERDAYSNIVTVTKGQLSIPTGLTVSVTDNIATISATNNSDASVYTGTDNTVKRLFLQIIYRGNKYNTEGINVGIISTQETSAQVTLPDLSQETSYSIGVKAVVGTYTVEQRADGVSIYNIVEDMSSETVWSTESVAKPPANMKAVYDRGLRLSWDWTWQDADSVELSWSEDETAWESTDQPETYLIDKVATSWIIKGLETGKRYYIKARFKKGEAFSPYSDTVFADLTAPPIKPILSLNNAIVSLDGKVTASWNYVSVDGTGQNYAEVVCNNEVIGHTGSEKHITMYVKDLGWTVGSYQLILRVKAESGSFSEYSDPVSVTVASPITAVIASDSLENVTVIDDEEVTRTVVSLTEMPLLVRVTGAGNGGNTALAIERAEPYYLDRPDETVFGGYEGETVYLKKQVGEAEIVVENGDLIGYLDDGAKYRIVATISDGLGQTSTATKDFEVHWNHQAIMPEGTVVVEDYIAKITPTAPTGVGEGDYCDIYRLSADKPELIYPHADFGQTIVDPYVAINGGYRLVFKTANNDYITEDNTLAVLDIDSEFESDMTIIDFGTDTVELYYNVDTNHTWDKDFRETKYLGGAVQGDWNPAVSRSASVSAITMNLEDQEIITALRRLAVYSGICNVRTKDGSSFHADVQVSENNSHDKYGLLTEFSLEITRVDPQGYDGISLEAWED